MPSAHSSRFPFFLVLLLGVVLAVLAGLQWRWIGQWSDVEEARLQSTLVAGGADLDLAFSQRVEEAADTFRELNAVDADAAVALADRWQQWTAAAPDPALIEAVYWIVPGQSPRAFRFDPSGVDVIETEWPEGWASWYAYFARQPSEVAAPPGTTLSIHFDDTDSPTSPPGIALPVLPPPGPSPLPVRFVFLALDAGMIQQRLLPALVDQHLLTPTSFDVLIAPSEGDALFTSRPGLGPADFDAPDLDQSMGPRAFNQLTVMLASPDGGPAQVVELAELKTERAIPNPSGRWRLRVQHRAGSIGAAVAGLRHRQLALAFGVLLILAAATALLVRSAQTQRRLAQRQMDFVAGVTHEIRTPLAVIRSAGENLADGVITESTQTQAYGALIRDEGQRLTDLVEGVLALAGADTRARSPQPLDLYAVIAEAIEQTEPVLARHDRSLTTTIAPDLPTLNGDAVGVTMALRNLLVNAARYGGPHVTLTAEAAAPDGQPSVVVTVRDDGPGLSAADLPTLFEPFVRGSAGAASGHPGAGLGLALVQRVAEAHGGSVVATHAPDGGSVFTLTIPAAS